MTDNKQVSNLNISNKMLASYLQEKRLVLPSDIVIETSESISDSIALYLNENGVKSIFLNSASEEDIERSFKFNNEFKNFICNGVSSNINFCIKQVLESGAFNVGICTNNAREFSSGKKFYQKIHRKLIALGIPVQQTEECLEKGKLYLLSYRTWK